jgi:hypothetical protein
MLDRRAYLRLLAAGVPASALFGGPSFPTTVADRVDRRYEAPITRPMGIKATRDGIWLVDGETAMAYLMSFQGQIKAEIETGTERPTAIESDEVGIWIAGDEGKKLIRIEFLDEDGEVDYEMAAQKAEFDAPGVGAVKWGQPGEYMREIGVQGLAWIRGELYCAVPAAAKIIVVKGQDGSVIRELSAPGIRPQGCVIAPDGFLWCADGNSRSFYKMDTASGHVIKQHMLPFDQPEKDGKIIVPHGITIWQRMIYFCSPHTSEIYRTPLVNRMS